MGDTVFIIGAGFNADAGTHIKSIHEFVSYPTVSDLARTCFGLRTIPDETSIENLFQKAIDDRNAAPVRVLADSIMKADYYLTNLMGEGKDETRHYNDFLSAFPESNFISFNYDAFLEILLLKCRQWRPEDGFGVPVRAWPRVNSVGRGFPEKSQRIVLHMHGSLYIYTQKYIYSDPDRSGTRWQNELEVPMFLFDPDTVGRRFIPFERVPPGLHYRPVRDRIIAPVPDKAQALREVFVRRSLDNAARLISGAETLICIGYRFSPADESSYARLLRTAKEQGKRLHIVAPDAQEITSRLASEFGVDCKAIPSTFSAWAHREFEV